MRTHRFGVMVTVVALILSACGGTLESSETPATTAPTANTPVVETTAPPEVASESDAMTSTTTDSRPAPDPDREPAPDFTLALADGSTFVLSEETRPVFMVFWAEW